MDESEPLGKCESTETAQHLELFNPNNITFVYIHFLTSLLKLTEIQNSVPSNTI